MNADLVIYRKSKATSKRLNNLSVGTGWSHQMPIPQTMHQSSSVRTAHRRPRRIPKFEVERLEDRLLLAANLSVHIDQLILPDSWIPGDRGRMVVSIQNDSNETVRDTANLVVDAIGTADPLQLGGRSNQRLNLRPGTTRSITLPIRIPTDIQAGLPGTYTPRLNVSYASGADADTAVATQSSQLVWQFGTLPGRRGLSRLQLSDGTSRTTLTLSGPGSATLTPIGQQFSLDVRDTSQRSRVQVITSGRSANPLPFSSINVTGPLGSLTATRVDLLGNLNADLGLGRLLLGDATGGTINIGSNTSMRQSIQLRRVTDVDIVANDVSSLRVIDWQDSDATADSITASTIRDLRVTGDRRSNVAGDFHADITLTGTAGVRRSISNASIAGDIESAQWIVHGDIGNVRVANASSWQTRVIGDLQGLTATGDFNGHLYAHNISRLQVDGHLELAALLAGSDLGSDFQLGGDGDNADTFGVGSITNLQVRGRFDRSYVAAGLDPVDTSIDNADDAFRGGKLSSIRSIRIGDTMNATSRIAASVLPPSVRISGVTVFTDTDSRFRDPRSDTVTPTVSNVDHADFSTLNAIERPITIQFSDNQEIDRATVIDGVIQLVAEDLTVIDTRLIETTTASNGSFVTAVFHAIAPINGWSEHRGDYQVRVLDQAVRDVAGNPVAGGVIATFNDQTSDPSGGLAFPDVWDHQPIAARQRVSPTDTSDTYRIVIEEPGMLQVDLTSLTADADVRLIQDIGGDRQIGEYNGDVLAWDWQRSNEPETISRFVEAGTYFVQVMSVDGADTSYDLHSTFTPTPENPRPFSIEINVDASIADVLPTRALDAIQEAATRWERVITASTFRRGHTLTLNVVASSLTGPGDVLAVGGPRQLRVDTNGNRLPLSGHIQLSIDKLDELETNPTLANRIILHETGHALGFGTLWDFASRDLTRFDSDLDLFVYSANTSAGEAYADLINASNPTPVPVTVGGDHWSEDIFGNELMTPTISLQQGFAPISRLTIASLRDIGWSVNFGAADFYSLPN